MVFTEAATPPTTETQLHEDELASKAKQLFIKANIKCPISSSAQGAYIADHLDAKADDPEALVTALLESPEALDSILKAATHAHARNNIPSTVSMEAVKYIVRTSFDWAEKMKGKPHDELAEIYEYASQNTNKRRSIRRSSPIQWLTSVTKRAFGVASAGASKPIK